MRVLRERTALVAGDVRLSYREVADYACRLAQALRARGVRRGERVVVFMDNDWRCAVSIFGVLLAGGVFITVNAQTKHNKLAFILRDAGAHVLLSESHLVRVFGPVAEQLPTLQVLCTATKAEALPANGENLDAALADQPTTPPPQFRILHWI